MYCRYRSTLIGHSAGHSAASGPQVAVRQAPQQGTKESQGAVDLSSEILFFSKLRARFLQVTGDVQYQSGRSQTLKYHIISHDNIM